MLCYAAQTVPGTNKAINEDRVFINNHIFDAGTYSGSKNNSLLAVVCDGVGGENGGDYAATIAACDFLPVSEKDFSSDYCLQHLININKDINNLQDDYYFFRKMATTIAGIYIKENNYCCFHLGDTRVYKYSNGVLSQLSQDHTVAEQKLADGRITSINDARKSERNTLTRFLGGYGFDSRPTVKDGIINDATLFIICSDGVYKAFDNENELKAILDAYPSVQSKTEAVMQFALQNGSTDDKSIIIIEYLPFQATSHNE